MATALTGLLVQSRDSRSESVTKGPVGSINELENISFNRSNSVSLPGSLRRHQRTHVIRGQYRSMLDVEDIPSLMPITPEESIIVQCESAIDGIVQKLKHTTTSTDWADILCFYTAANGVAPVAPTRSSPAPNGKAVSPSQEVPQSVSSTDPKVAAQQASDMRNIVRRKLTGYVGFANLPNQWHRKSVRKGFNFNVMVVGMLKFCA